LIWSTLQGLQPPAPEKELPPMISFNPPMPELTDAAQKSLRDSILKARDVLAREPAGKPISIRLGFASDSADVGRRIVAVRCLAALGSLRPLLDRLTEERDKAAWQETVKSIRHYITVSRDNEYTLFDALKKRHSAGESMRIMELLDGLANVDALVDFLDNPHVTIRQLAHLNLCEVEPAGKDIPYDARMEENQRVAAQQAWMKLLHKK
jgi:hypothetical protein